MSVTSKSPKAVLLTAWRIAKASLPAHRHLNSPKKFTQHQLLACLVLKNFLKTDYRGLVESLADCDSLSKAIELACIPHDTTFPKAGRPTAKPASGNCRRLMQTRFDEETYRLRTQVETVMSTIKRRQGSFCKGRKYWSRCKELSLMVLTHNIMILLPLLCLLQSHNKAIPKNMRSPLRSNWVIFKDVWTKHDNL